MTEMEITVALGGVLIGASLVVLIARLCPHWLGLTRPSSATERLETIRDSLIADLQKVAEEMRTSPKPIRMDRGRESEGSERRAA